MALRPSLVLFFLGGLAVGCTNSRAVDDPFGSADTGSSATASGSGTTSTSTSATTGDTTEITTTITTTTATTTTATSGLDTTDGGSTGRPAECGNGVKEGDEACDGEDFGDETCETQGFDAGDLLCNANCLVFSTEQCFICGNDVIEGVETCDGSVPMGITCETEGFTEGMIACDAATCQLDTTGCSLCGDGVIEGNEQCDDIELGGETCESLGLIGGDLACDAASCTYDITGCDSFTENFETGQIESYWTTGGNAVWIADSNNPIAGSFSGASGTITHNQQSSLSITLNYATDSTISFWHEESTEGSFDYLRFYIDAVEQASWSGTNAATMETYNVTAGTHTFEWRYTKDGSVNTGQDRVWVDDINAPGGQAQ